MLTDDFIQLEEILTFNQSSMKKCLITSALAFLLTIVFAQNNGNMLFPHIADVSHTTKDQAELMYSFFMAKSRHEVKNTISFFSKDMATYTDATLGWPIDGYDALHKMLSQYMPQWPETGLSYPTRIIGGNGSVIVGFTDTPELFGGEIRALGAIDFKDGKIVRWVDYWDSRNFNTELFLKLKTPKENFPTDFKESVVGENASKKMIDLCTQLQNAFSNSNPQAVSDLFSFDAIYEDMSLRTQLFGKFEIIKYLTKALPKMPFGKGSKLRHIVGNDLGGGFEWTGSANTQVNAGITAIEVDDKGSITRLTIVYDSRLIDDKQLLNLASISLNDCH